MRDEREDVEAQNGWLTDLSDLFIQKENQLKGILVVILSADLRIVRKQDPSFGFLFVLKVK